MPSKSARANELLVWALKYAAKGWPVVPIHSAKDGRCTCETAGCRSAGKHPRTRHGVDDATTSEETIREWWSTWPAASIGLACGVQSGLFVLDVDAKAPKVDGAITGIEALEHFEARHGKLPETLEAATGGGGRHLFFRLPADRVVPNKVGVKGPRGEPSGLDVRSTGGYVVLHPSTHISGEPYRWTNRIHIVDAPAALLDSIAPIEKPEPARLRVAPRVLDGDRERRYALGALNHACQRILFTAEGSRHLVLIRESSIMGGYVVAGHLSEAEAFDGLVVAGKQAGKPSKEVERTVRDGLVLGRDTPRGAPPREDPGPSPDLKATPPTDEDLGVDHTLQVRRQLHRAKKTGLPAVSLHNAITVLMEDPCYRGRLTWDAFIGRAEIDGRPLLDADVIELRRAINAEYGLNIGRDLGSDAVLHVASQSKHDPLRDYLDGLVWDGTERCTWLLARYFGASNDELSKSYSVKWMISAVARAMDPGCKVDTILVLRGVQSAKKSTGLEALVPVQDWFSDSDVDVQSKEGAISIQGKWVVEIAELESFRGKAQTAIKAFLSRRIDHFRAPYGRIAEDHPRRTVFVGSTNAETFLSDPTGSRRLWVVEAQHVDVLGLRRERDQLWAEAVIRYRRGETWWLSADEDLARGVSAEDYQIQEPWEPLILTWLQLPATKLMLASGITTTDAMRLALAIEPARMTRGAEMDVANILRKLGLKRRRLRGSGSVREYRYSP